jgi:uncharacterized SAM-binding protein YcdF (DUF218 family)
MPRMTALLLRYSAAMAGIVVIFVVLSHAGATLVIDRPSPADAILVLSGDYQGRMPRAIELYKQGYAKQIVVDEDGSRKYYGQTLADRRRAELAAADPTIDVKVCPVLGATTSAESNDVARCLEDLKVKSVLIVTSDFHTRRALSIMRFRMPFILWSVAASKSDYDSKHWWEHGGSAETLLEEWVSLVYWTTFEQHTEKPFKNS